MSKMATVSLSQVRDPLSTIFTVATGALICGSYIVIAAYAVWIS
jgi:hypothetical protein